MESIPEEDVARVVVMSDEEMKTISSNVDDLCLIDDLNEKSLFQTLKLRYHEKKIYTFISSILISLNPFQEMQIYTPDVLKSYILGTVSLDSPHIYGLSRVAFNRMVLDKVNQSIIISGESGAVILFTSPDMIKLITYHWLLFVRENQKRQSLFCNILLKPHRK